MGNPLMMPLECLQSRAQQRALKLQRNAAAAAEAAQQMAALKLSIDREAAAEARKADAARQRALYIRSGERCCAKQMPLG